MHLAAEAVARILEMGDTETGPGGSVVFVLFDDTSEEVAGALKVLAAAGAGHEGGQNGTGLEVFLGEILIERGGRERRAAMIFVRGLKIAEALQGAEDFVADLGLDADQVEGSDVDRAAGADALADDVEERPVEVEAFFGPEEVAGKDEVDEKFFTDAERIELHGGDGHKRR